MKLSMGFGSFEVSFNIFLISPGDVRDTLVVYSWSSLMDNICPHPAALLPTVSIHSGQCGRLYTDLLICTSSFWWSIGEWQVMGRSDCHSIPCCGPGLWWSVLEYFHRHICLWGGAGVVEVLLRPLHPACIAWYEDWFPPGTWSKYIPW